MATIGAVAMAIYLSYGRQLREWMPLFLYAMPVTLIGGIVAIIASMLLEEGVNVMIGNEPSRSTFGFLHESVLAKMTYIGLGPGDVFC